MLPGFCLKIRRGFYFLSFTVIAGSDDKTMSQEFKADYCSGAKRTPRMLKYQQNINVRVDRVYFWC
jgi:hypothetical protein